MDGQPTKPWHTLSAEEVSVLLRTSQEGLSSAEAEKRLKEYGKNALRTKPGKSLGAMIKAQLTDPLVLILVGAVVLSAFLEEWTEAAVIAAIVVVNAVIGIVQEIKAQSSLNALKSISTPTARVLRDAEEAIVPAEELVPGDVVILADGDIIPADLRLLEAVNLKIQEASLTGEAMPVVKDTGLLLKEKTVLGDRSNMAYTSSLVTYGRGIGMVAATGGSTELGTVAALLAGQDQLDTPLKRKLNAAGKALTIIGLIVCVIIVAIGALYGKPLGAQLLIAISLAISIIPEGLPATATIVMAIGVQRMAKKHALVRKLPAVETLGNTTVICSDKTGTLTLNKMTVTKLALIDDCLQSKNIYVAAAIAAKDRYNELFFAGALCNDASFDIEGKAIIGDPTEGALICLAKKAGLPHEELEAKYPRVWEQPFDSVRKRMTTLHQFDKGFRAYTKGAPEELLACCRFIWENGNTRELTGEDRSAVLAMCEQMSGDALRTLGFAFRDMPAVPDSATDMETELTFIGMVGIIDPPRKDVAESVRACYEAGIRIVMITGDHKTTAIAIAKELNILRKGNRVITGGELNELSNEELVKAVQKTTVFARVTPADKLRIVKALKRSGEVTAMTGDGVNDAPALKEADIGIAMGITGTDVAKDAADMVLLDDRFTTIVDAVKEGRRVYRNIQKVIQFLLAGNIAEITTLIVATLLNWETPLLAVHILWVNLATATLPALALGVDPPSANIMKHPPVKSGTLFDRAMVNRVLTQGIFVAGLTIAAFWIGITLADYHVGQSMAFGVLAFSQIFRACNQRSNTEYIWVRAEGINFYLIAAVLVSSCLMGLIFLLPEWNQFFKVTELDGREYGIMFGLAVLSVVQMEAVKFLRRGR